MPQRYDIQQGFTVWGSDDRKIGTVKDCTDTYCHIDTGFLGLGPDYYIPFDAIEDVRGRDVLLNVPSDQISQMGWDREPTWAAGSGTMSGTMPYDRGFAEGRDYTERGAAQGETRGMPLREEELQAQRFREQAGEVDLGKRVVEEERQFDVPVTHEEVTIRERPVDRPAGKPIAEGETIRVPVTEEHVEVQKEPHVYGEVDVEKRRVTEQRPVSETVRKEVPEVKKEGNLSDRVENELDDNLTDEERRRRDEGLK